MKTLIEKALPGKGETKITLVESQNSYEQLLDDYLDGIDVLDNETISEYLKRQGFKGLLSDNDKAKINEKTTIKLASDFGDPSYIQQIVDSDILQIIDEFKKAVKKGYPGSLKDFTKEYTTSNIDARQKFDNGGVAKMNGKGSDDRPFTSKIERTYNILLTGDETLQEVLDLIRKTKDE